MGHDAEILGGYDPAWAMMRKHFRRNSREGRWGGHPPCGTLRSPNQVKDFPYDRLLMPIRRYEVKLKILRRRDRYSPSRPLTARHGDDPTDSPLSGLSLTERLSSNPLLPHNQDRPDTACMLNR